MLPKGTTTGVVAINSGHYRARFLASRDALVTAHLNLVAPIARRFHRKLPPSFDLAELLSVGNFALVRAATRYRPKENGGTPFDAYARAAIAGAIKDTFRRNKFAEQTRPGLDERPREGTIASERRVIPFPGPRPMLDERIDLARRIASLRDVITACLPPLQVKVMDLYYSPSMPDLATVALELDISENVAQKAHSAAIRFLKMRLAKAA